MTSSWGVFASVSAASLLLDTYLMCIQLFLLRFSRLSLVVF